MERDYAGLYSDLLDLLDKIQDEDLRKQIHQTVLKMEEASRYLHTGL